MVGDEPSSNVRILYSASDESWSHFRFVMCRDSTHSTSSGAIDMQHVAIGQCGLCSHFGEMHSRTEKLVQIRVSKEAPETLVDECSHPRHAPLHLKVTPI